MVLHPSQEYVLATSYDGSLHAFHLPDGEPRGEVQLPGRPPDRIVMDVEPSGLYLLLALLRRGASGQQTSSLLLLEVGTGEVAWQQDSLPALRTVTFSTTGRMFACGSEDGGIFFWRIEGEVLATIQSVTAAMARNEGFWQRYPIDLRPSARTAEELSPRPDESPSPPAMQSVRPISPSPAILQSARSVGTVGSYAGSDGTGDSLEVLDALRQALDEIEEREMHSRRGQQEQVIHDLDNFEKRLAQQHNVQHNDSPDIEPKKHIHFGPLPAPAHKMAPKAPSAPVFMPSSLTPAQALIAAKQAEPDSLPFGVGQAI